MHPATLPRCGSSRQGLIYLIQIVARGMQAILPVRVSLTSPLLPYAMQVPNAVLKDGPAPVAPSSQSSVSRTSSFSTSTGDHRSNSTADLLNDAFAAATPAATAAAAAAVAASAAGTNADWATFDSPSSADLFAALDVAPAQPAPAAAVSQLTMQGGPQASSQPSAAWEPFESFAGTGPTPAAPAQPAASAAAPQPPSSSTPSLLQSLGPAFGDASPQTNASQNHTPGVAANGVPAQASVPQVVQAPSDPFAVLDPLPAAVSSAAPQPAASPSSAHSNGFFDPFSAPSQPAANPPAPTISSPAATGNGVLPAAAVADPFAEAATVAPPQSAPPVVLNVSSLETSDSWTTFEGPSAAAAANGNGWTSFTDEASEAKATDSAAPPTSGTGPPPTTEAGEQAAAAADAAAAPAAAGAPAGKPPPKSEPLDLGLFSDLSLQPQQPAGMATAGHGLMISSPGMPLALPPAQAGAAPNPAQGAMAHLPPAMAYGAAGWPATSAPASMGNGAPSWNPAAAGGAWQQQQPHQHQHPGTGPATHAMQPAPGAHSSMGLGHSGSFAAGPMPVNPMLGPGGPAEYSQPGYAPQLAGTGYAPHFTGGAASMGLMAHAPGGGAPPAGHAPHMTGAGPGPSYMPQAPTPHDAALANANAFPSGMGMSQAASPHEAALANAFNGVLGMAMASTGVLSGLQPSSAAPPPPAPGMQPQGLPVPHMAAGTPAQASSSAAAPPHGITQQQWLVQQQQPNGVPSAAPSYTPPPGQGPPSFGIPDASGNHGYPGFSGPYGNVPQGFAPTQQAAVPAAPFDPMLSQGPSLPNGNGASLAVAESGNPFA